MKDKINDFLKELFYEDWMNDNDWLMFLETLETQSGISVESLSKDLEIGIANGHSVEHQFHVIRNILQNAK